MNADILCFWSLVPGLWPFVANDQEPKTNDRFLGAEISEGERN